MYNNVQYNFLVRIEKEKRKKKNEISTYRPKFELSNAPISRLFDNSKYFVVYWWFELSRVYYIHCPTRHEIFTTIILITKYFTNLVVSIHRYNNKFDIPWKTIPGIRSKSVSWSPQRWEASKNTKKERICLNNIPLYYIFIVLLGGKR